MKRFANIIMISMSSAVVRGRPKTFSQTHSVLRTFVEFEFNANL